MPQPELIVRYRRTSELVPYARNARTHSEAQIAQIAGSIREFGFTNPVLLDGDSGILAGHGRVLGAQMPGLARRGAANHRLSPHDGEGLQIGW
jgi:ParB-like chromosome segregation protein Spo0J